MRCAAACEDASVYGLHSQAGVVPVSFFLTNEPNRWQSHAAIGHEGVIAVVSGLNKAST